MKRISKILISLILIISISVIGIVNIYAWTNPNIKTKYEENDVEFRSVWVCTVSNMDMEKQIGKSTGAINAWKNQYLSILENAIKMNMNAIIFQVRPCNDAFYPSKYNPWSEYLAGFGVDPGWDPLEWMIEVTHAAGLEYHAWLNPYRASVNSLSFNITQDVGSGTKIYDYDETEAANYKEQYFSNLKKICLDNDTLVDNPIFSSGDDFNHDVLYGTEGKFILNPASSLTVKHLENTIQELVDNYDLDGIHFDDYFYPATKNYMGTNPEYKTIGTFSCEPKVDLADYQAFINSGGTVEGDEELTNEENESRQIYNWRRQNVNNLIKSLSDIIRTSNKKKKVNCAFGISPAARWAPSVEYCGIRGAVGGMGGSGDCNNYYSYSDLYADVYKWVKEEWIDYIVPQVYTYLGTASAGYPSGSYNSLVKWWSNACEGYDVKLFIGTPAYQVATWKSSGTSSYSEIYWQIRWNQDQKYNVDGYVMFRYKSLVENNELTTCMKAVLNIWKKAALTPVYEKFEYPVLEGFAESTKLELNADGSYTITYTEVDNAKAYAVTENGKVVARSLSCTPLTFNKTDDATYELITYALDNTIYQEKEVIDFNKTIVNEAPIVSCSTTLDEEYLINSTINLCFKVVDPEGGKVTYSLQAISGTNIFDLVKDTPVSNNEVNYEFKCYAVEFEDMIIKLTVNDGFGEVTFKTSSFNIVKKLKEKEDDSHITEQDPVDNSEEDKKEENQNQETTTTKKKGCKKNTNLLFNLFSVISMISVLILFIRKRK